MMTIHEAIEYLEQRISWASMKGDYDIFIQGRKADDLLALLKSMEEQPNIVVQCTQNGNQCTNIKNVGTLNIY